MVTDVLVHYGVLGMKWGIRKKERSSGSSRLSDRGLSDSEKTANKKASNDAIKTAKMRKTMSLEDLQKTIEKRKAERQLREITEEEYQPVKTFIKRAAKSAGSAVASAAGVALFVNAVNAGAQAANGQFNPLKSLLDFAGTLKNQVKR